MYNRLLAFLALLVTLQMSATPCAAQLEMPESDPPSGIEHWMREYQARLLFAMAYRPEWSDWQDQPPTPVVWPPNSPADDAWAPVFPEDHYYDGLIKDNPGAAVSLVQSLKGAFFGGVIWTDAYGVDYTGQAVYQVFLKTTMEGAAYNEWPCYRFTDFQTLFETPVTTDNWRGILQQLQAAIASLTSSPRACGLTSVGESGSYRRRASHVASSTDYATAQTAAVGNAQCCWNPSCFCGPEDTCCFSLADTRGWAVINSEYLLLGLRAAETVNVTVLPGAFDVGYEYVRDAARISDDLRGFPGTASFFLNLESLRDGSLPNAPVAADELYHQIGSGVGDQVLRSEAIGYSDAPPASGESFAEPSTSASRERGWQPHAQTQVGGAYVTVLTPTLDTRPSSERAGCSSCGGGALPSAPSFEGGRVNVGFSLGRSADGRPAGSFELRAPTVAGVRALPARLIYTVRPSAVSLSYGPGAGPARDVEIGTGAATVRVSAVEPPVEEPDSPFSANGWSNYEAVKIDMYVGSPATGDPYSSTLIERWQQDDQAYAVPPQMLKVTTTGQCPSETIYRSIGDTTEMLTGIDAAGVPARREQWTISSPTTGVVTRSSSVWNADNSLAASSSESRATFPWGDETIQRTAGADQSINWTYDDRMVVNGQPNPGYGRLRVSQPSHGPWRYFEYGADGTETVVTQFLDHPLDYSSDAAVAALKQQNAVTITKPVTVTLAGAASAVAVRERREWLLDHDVALSYSASIEWIANPGYVENWQIRCADPTPWSNIPASLAAAVTDPSGNPDRVEFHRLVGESPVLSIQDEQGQWHTAPSAEQPMPVRPVLAWTSSGNLTKWEYSPDGLVVSTASGPSNATRDDVRGGTKSEVTRLPSGVVRYSRTYSLANPASPVLTSEDEVPLAYIDEFGRVSRRNSSDGTHTETIHDCCGVSSTVSADGLTRSFTRDTLHRTTFETTEYADDRQILMGTIYDAEGNVLSESRTGTEPGPSGQPPVVSVIVQRVNTYDLAGRMTSSTDALDRTTTYQEEVVGSLILETTTQPDPDDGGPLSAPYVKRYSYPDGRTKEVSGTGTHEVRYEYGVESVQIRVGATTSTATLRFTKETRGDTNTQWVKTYVDALGRPVRTLFPDANGDSSPTGPGSYTWYDDPTGRLRQGTQDPDGQVTLMFSGYGPEDVPSGWPQSGGGLSWNGPWSLVVQDYYSTPANPSADGIRYAPDFAGKDRITQQRSELVAADANRPLRRRTTSTIWTTDGSDTQVYSPGASESRIVNSAVAVGGGYETSHSWQDMDGHTTESYTVVDAGDHTRTTTAVLPTGETSEDVTRYGRHESSTRWGPVSSGGGSAPFISESRSVYDPHGRVAQSRRIVDPNNSALDVVTSYIYADDDQVWTQEDPPANPSFPEEYNQTVYGFDGMGRRTIVYHVPFDASQQSTTTVYAPTGEVTQVSGFGVTPVRHEYDSQGRLYRLKTYQNWGNGSSPTGEAITTWNYDPYRGWLTFKQYNDGNGTTYTYTPAGRLASRSWARTIGNPAAPVITSYTYTCFGEISTTDYSDDTPDVAMTYDRMGRAHTVSDAAGLRTLVYDNAGRVQTESVVTDTSTGASLLDGLTITHSYNSDHLRDGLNVQVGSAGRSVAYGYDDRWRLDTVTKDDVTAEYEYDDFTGQVQSVHHKRGTSNPQSVLYTEREFDRLGRFTGVNHFDAPGGAAIDESTEYVYDGFGRRTTAWRADGSSWYYTYNNKNELSVGGLRFPDVHYVPGAYFAYTYDDIGNRKNATEGGGYSFPLPTDYYTSNYSMNLLNQYTSREVSGNIEVLGRSQSASSTVLVNGQTAWRHPTDPNSTFFHKRLSFSNSTSPAMESVDVQEVPGDTHSYQVFLPHTPEQFEYDADGNLTLDGVWVYEWDAENRLKAMWMRPEVAAIRLSSSYWVRLEFSYDYLGRRIAKKLLKGGGDTSWSVEKASQNMIWADNKLEKFAYDGWMPVAAYESSLVDNSFIRFTGSWAWGPDLSGTLGGAGGIGGLAVATDDLWDNEHPSNGVGPMVPVYDGNGNIQRLLRALDREVEAKYEYGPFGETRSIDGPLGQHNPFRWSTKYTDSETGLVYYGYRYYSAGLGRWPNRDPIEERDAALLYRAFENAPISRSDPLGLATRWSATADAVEFDLNFTVGPSFALFGFGMTYGIQRLYNCTEGKTNDFFYIGWYVGFGVGLPVASATVTLSAGMVYGLPQNSTFAGSSSAIGGTAGFFGGITVQFFGNSWFGPFGGTYWGFDVGVGFVSPQAGVSYSRTYSVPAATNQPLTAVERRKYCPAQCGPFTRMSTNLTVPVDIFDGMDYIDRDVDAAFLSRIRVDLMAAEPAMRNELRRMLPREVRAP